MAQSCHPSGTAVPSVWHSCAIKVAQPWMAKEVVRMKKMADSLFFPVKSEYQNEFHP